jgi:hypothetical protein
MNVDKFIQKIHKIILINIHTKSITFAYMQIVPVHSKEYDPLLSYLSWCYRQSFCLPSLLNRTIYHLGGIQTYLPKHGHTGLLLFINNKLYSLAQTEYRSRKVKVLLTVELNDSMFEFVLAYPGGLWNICHALCLLENQDAQ